MRELIIQFSGWLPAIALPGATLAQLWKIIRTKNTEGVSILTWLLFGFANLGIYVFTEKYGAIQSILAQLLTSILNFIIVGWILTLRASQKRSQSSPL